MTKKLKTQAIKTIFNFHPFLNKFIYIQSSIHPIKHVKKPTDKAVKAKAERLG